MKKKEPVTVKVNWKDVRHKMWAWSHVAVCIAGDRDYCRCTECGDEAELLHRHRSRASVLLEMARVHYYKHKRWLSI